jgi:hypothetical protein
VNIDVIDNEDPVVGTDVNSELDGRGVNSTRVQMYGMCNGVGQMITDITQVAPVAGIGALRIWSHGGPGGQNVSAGQADMDVHWAGISVANIEQIRDTLTRLAPYFSPNGWAELRGCNVAADADGEALLQRLAAIWGVPVQAGILAQSGIDWVGPVHQSDPAGNMSCTAGTLVQ